MGKPDLVSWENLILAYAKNKDSDQLCGNLAADQRICFRYIDCRTLFLPKSEILGL